MPDGAGEMGLAGAGGADDEHRRGAGDEARGGEFVQQHFLFVGHAGVEAIPSATHASTLSR